MKVAAADPFLCFALRSLGVQRHPRNVAERAHNIDAVIRELAFAVPDAVRGRWAQLRCGARAERASGSNGLCCLQDLTGVDGTHVASGDARGRSV
jgi:hypothetical protein